MPTTRRRASGFKLLGSEPAAIASGVEVTAAAVLALLVAFHVGLSEQQVGLILAALTAVLSVVVAAVTHHTVLAGVVGAIKALAALAIGFGVHLTPEQLAVIVGAVTSIGGLYLRTQTSPLPTKLTRASVRKAA